MKPIHHLMIFMIFIFALAQAYVNFETNGRLEYLETEKIRSDFIHRENNATYKFLIEELISDVVELENAGQCTEGKKI